jgi:hypothetical protein
MEESSPQATQLVKLALESGVELWHDREENAYATIPVHGRREHRQMRSSPSRKYLAGLFYKSTSKAASAQALQDALGTLEARALFESPCHSVFVRVAGDEDSIYLDLADDTGRAVRITGEGWSVITDPPVRFRRPKGILPLPVPEDGGRLGELRHFLNVSEEHFPLIAAWLAQAVRPNGPYPPLEISGEQGAAKSTAARILRSIIDPNIALLRAEPRAT